jgi:hypothetical protein
MIPQPLLLPVLAGAAVSMAAAAAMLDGLMRRLFSPPADTFDVVEMIADWRRPR